MPRSWRSRPKPDGDAGLTLLGRVPRRQLTVKQETEFVDLTGRPRWNPDQHVKNKHEQRDHRRLDTERQYVRRNSGLKMDVDCHKHHKEEARASD